MTEQTLNRAEILVQQQRYQDAEPLLRQLLAAEPDNLQVLWLLAEIQIATNALKEAHELIDSMMALAPDHPHPFYLRARVLVKQEKMKEAVESLEEAIALDPEDADYPALLATIQVWRKRYEEALEQADRALELDAENILALNARTTALQKLNRTEEAHRTIEGALREDPNNSYTHSNFGWNLLESGDHKKAREHFREALQHDPNNEHAQQGMVEAIKATNPLYRGFLKYSFWMSNLTSRYQWGVILGFYIGMRLLRALAASNEWLRPFLTPLVVLLAIFAFSTWIITPLSNLLFRLHPYGRFLLDRQERLASTFVGISLLVSVAGWALYAFSGQEPWIALGALGMTLMVPLGNMFAVSKFRYALLLYPLAMLLTGILAVAQALQSGILFNGFTLAYIIAFMLYSWVANFLMIRQGNYA